MKRVPVNICKTDSIYMQNTEMCHFYPSASHFKNIMWSHIAPFLAPACILTSFVHFTCGKASSVHALQKFNISVIRFICGCKVLTCDDVNNMGSREKKQIRNRIQTILVKNK